MQAQVAVVSSGPMLIWYASGFSRTLYRSTSKGEYEW